MRPLHVVLSTLLVASVGLAQGKEKDPSEPITVTFDGTDLDRVIKLVSDELSIRVLYDDRVRNRKVTLLSPVAVKRRDLLPLLLTILEMQGFTMVRSGPREAEVWKIVPMPSPIINPANKGNLPVVVLEHLDRLPDDESLATLLVMLRNADARSVFIAAQGMVSDPRMVQAIETADAILLTDTAQNLRRIGGLLQELAR